MSKTENPGIDRRRFIQNTAAATVAAVCFSSDALALATEQAAAAGKPLLTEKTFNTMVQKMDKKEWVTFMDEMEKGFAGMIRNRFFLTPKQVSELEAMPKTVTGAIEKSVGQMRGERHTTFVLSIPLPQRPDEVCRDGYVYVCHGEGTERECVATLTLCKRVSPRPPDGD